MEWNTYRQRLQYPAAKGSRRQFTRELHQDVGFWPSPSQAQRSGFVLEASSPGRIPVRGPTSYALAPSVPPPPPSRRSDRRPRLRRQPSSSIFTGSAAHKVVYCVRRGRPWSGSAASWWGGPGPLSAGQWRTCGTCEYVRVRLGTF